MPYISAAMKILFLFCFVVIAPAIANAQTPVASPSPRHVRFKVLPGDSAILSFNKSYQLIEDSCADIVRYAHYDAVTRKFSGPFKDVNHNNSAQLISEGHYNTDGMKDGVFTCYYFNGILQSKGRFVNNKPEGHWETFYENGKPQISFDENNGVVKINNEWDKNGDKIVTDGKGLHRSKIAVFTWKGKLDNGIPDGKWESYKTDDATETAVTEEHFKKGVFIKGTAPTGNYTDASRMVLISDLVFPYTEAEQLHTSPINCDGFGHRHVVGARYSQGPASYSEAMRVALHPILSNLHVKTLNYTMVITGEISEDGSLILLTTNDPFNADMGRRIIAGLRTLPPLNPATADGKPIKQKFEFVINFSQGHYKYNHHFLPIKQADIQ